jgi:hypothetical protein
MSSLVLAAAVATSVSAQIFAQATEPALYAFAAPPQSKADGWGSAFKASNW